MKTANKRSGARYLGRQQKALKRNARVEQKSLSNTNKSTFIRTTNKAKIIKEPSFHEAGSSNTGQAVLQVFRNLAIATGAVVAGTLVLFGGGQAHCTEAPFVEPPTPVAATVVPDGFQVASLDRVDADDGEVWKASKFWPTPDQEMDVDIDGRDFDFEPNRGSRGERVKGFVDGPLKHNGRYQVLVNRGNQLELKVHFGNNDAQNNDMDVVISVRDGQATIKGVAQGVDLGPDGVSAPVTGNGTKASPFRIAYTDSEGIEHVVTWCPD